MSTMGSSMGGFGRPSFTQAEPAGQKICGFWPLGECKSENSAGGCTRAHPPNLSPRQTKELPDFVINNDPSKACRRCLILGIECDKLGRNGDNDPCSECRWFAGGQANTCQIVARSINDSCWDTMISRDKYNYTLPEPKAKDKAKEVPAEAIEKHLQRVREAEKSGKPRPKDMKPPKVPSPMNGVRADWTGETRAALLIKPHQFPPQVLKHPRAYLVPPRPSGVQLNNQAHHAAHASDDRKRKRDDLALPSARSAAMMGTNPQHQYLSPITSMPRDAYGRPATRVMWDDVNKTWTNWYADGSVATSAPYNVGYLSQPPLVPTTRLARQPVGGQSPSPSTTLPSRPNLPSSHTSTLRARPNKPSTSFMATPAEAQPSDSDSADNGSMRKRSRVEESTPQPASNPPPRPEIMAVPDQMDVEPEKQSATTESVMPGMGLITENDEEDVINFDGDDDMDFDEIN